VDDVWVLSLILGWAGVFWVSQPLAWPLSKML
jgi:hypothetical protein